MGLRWQQGLGLRIPGQGPAGAKVQRRELKPFRVRKGGRKASLA